MPGHRHEFDALVAARQPSGEVVVVRRFIVEVDGLAAVPAGAVVLFENGEHGFVRAVRNGKAQVLTLTGEGVPVGTLAVLKATELAIPVGAKLNGRVVNPLVHPLDGKGAILSKQIRPLFGPAPTFSERSRLDTQLETGVTVVDTLFPIVLGQRIAVMGDAKSGKTTFLTQVAINQARMGHAVVLVLVAKRKTDVEHIIARLEAAKVRSKVVLVVATVFDSVIMQFLAPYAGVAIAEELWYGGQDVVVLYDDFSSHAKLYREISLLTQGSPGRESYPGDMFFTHSSLLERAGKLKANGKTLTALPVALTPNDDISGYLSTSLISMTDGQIVFDLETFHQGKRPAVNLGLSVSRVGGRAQASDHKQLASNVGRLMARARQAEQFSRFGSELSPDMRSDLYRASLVQSIFNQEVEETYSLVQQQVMLHAATDPNGQTNFSSSWLKTAVKEITGASKQSPQELALHLLKAGPKAAS